MACALENADLNGIMNAAFFAGEVGASLEELHDRSGDPDVAVVDPPRAGLSGKAVRRLARLEPQRIVYVSCNPTTLAGNVKELTGEWGYTLERVTPGRHVPAHAARRDGGAAHALSLVGVLALAREKLRVPTRPPARSERNPRLRPPLDVLRAETVTIARRGRRATEAAGGEPAAASATGRARPRSRPGRRSAPSGRSARRAARAGSRRPSRSRGRAAPCRSSTSSATCTRCDSSPGAPWKSTNATPRPSQPASSRRRSSSAPPPAGSSGSPSDSR